MRGLSEGFQVEGWVKGVGSHGPALRGGVLPSQVSVWSVVWGTLSVPSRNKWICDGNLTPEQLTASGAA